MKPIIMDLKDISDSREVYDSKPHPFLAWFILLVSIILVSGALWAYFFHIDIVLKANGIVNVTEDVQENISLISGTIEKCEVQDNDFVNEGDLLYEVNHEEITDNINELQDQLNNINMKMEILNAYLKTIEGSENSIDSKKDNIYYDEYITKYKLYINKRNSVEEQQKNTNEQNSLILNQLNGLGENEANNTTKVDNSKLEKLSLEELELQEKSSIYSEKNSIEITKVDLENKISKLNEELNKYKVYADKSGYINFKNDINQTNYISAGTPIYSIIPDGSENYEVYIYVDSADIGKIKEGMEVKYEFESYPSDEYGTVKGKILSVSKVSKAVDELGNNYYLVKASIDDEIKNNKGEKVELKSDMKCNSKIVVDNQSIMKYILNKINILN